MHTIPVQIRFSDIDGVGHVNNVVYGQYFDIGRLAYFNAVLGETHWNQGKIMVLVHTEADYLVPTFLNDKIRVHTSVIAVGNKSVTMEQEIVGADNIVRVKGRSVLSTYDFDTHKSFPLPDDWRRKIAATAS
jgi:acyl-CoA thioester hydrolase